MRHHVMGRPTVIENHIWNVNNRCIDVTELAVVISRLFGLGKDYFLNLQWASVWLRPTRSLSGPPHSATDPCNASSLRLIMIVHLLSFTSWLKFKKKNNKNKSISGVAGVSNGLVPNMRWIDLFISVSFAQNCGILGTPLLCHTHSGWCWSFVLDVLTTTECSPTPLGDTSVHNRAKKNGRGKSRSRWGLKEKNVHWRKIEQLTTVNPRWPAYTIHSNTGSKNLGFSKKSTNLWGSWFTQTASGPAQ